jgi:hypothetical protein
MQLSTTEQQSLPHFVCPALQAHMPEAVQVVCPEHAPQLSPHASAPHSWLPQPHFTQSPLMHC